MREKELFTIWVGLLIDCLYPADDVRELVLRPTELVISLLHHFERLALKSPVMTETIGSSLFMLSIRKYKFVQKFSICADFDLVNCREG